MNIKTVAIAAAVAVSGAAAPAFAHHSFAMFDRTKEMTLVGTVKEFQWTNPHSWIQINVPTNGKVVEWSIEGGSPNGLARKGWKSTTLKPGDKVTVQVNPMKDGSNGASLKSVTTADGKTLS
jgi:hypothetical protein